MVKGELSEEANRMEYHFKVHKEESGFWAECVELEGCLTQGDSKEELEVNMKEALNLYLDEPVESNMVFPLPKTRVKGKGIENVPVDPEIAFAVLLRHCRSEHKLSQNKVAKLLDMKNVFSYQRLEKKGNPKLSTLVKIQEIFPEFSIDYILGKQ